MPLICLSLRIAAYRCVVVVVVVVVVVALSFPCPYQGDVQYAFEQLDSGSFVASVSVAALERPIAGYPELKKAGRSRKIRGSRGRIKLPIHRPVWLFDPFSWLTQGS